MIQALKNSWSRLTLGKPGKRFQERYLRRRHTARGRFHKCLVITAGCLLFVAGLILIPAPGPGMLIAIVGASLIAQESLPAARLFDRAELRLRNLMKRVRT